MKWQPRWIAIDEQSLIQITVYYADDFDRWCFQATHLKTGYTYGPTIGFDTATRAKQAAQGWYAHNLPQFGADVVWDDEGGAS